MSDRILRYGIWSSKKFCSLPCMQARLIFINLIGRADDYGNLQADPYPIYREVRDAIDCKTEDDISRYLEMLADADLIRRYQVDGKRYFHIPNFKDTRTYRARKHPQAEWEVNPLPTAKELKEQAIAAKSTSVQLERIRRLAQADKKIGEEAQNEATNVDIQEVASNPPDAHQKYTPTPTPIEVNVVELEFVNPPPLSPRNSKEDASTTEPQPPLTPQRGGSEAQGIPEPKTPEPKKRGRTKNPTITFGTFVEQLKATRQKAISDYRPVLDYARQIKLPSEFLLLYWQEYKRRHLPGGTEERRRQADWRLAFLRHLQANYYRIWYYDNASGQFVLSTNGHAAQRATT